MDRVDDYRIQEDGTDYPFHNKYWNHHENGTYVCKNCGVKLFDSKTKFDSGTGWPAYDSPVTAGAIKYAEDTSYGMYRTKAFCANCGAYIGHVFNDGPKDTTGMRYCINSSSLDFKEDK